jgi:hypothetical protein
VSYSPSGPVGEYGLAISRANWHRSFLDQLVSVPLRVAPVELPELPIDADWWPAEIGGES